MQTAATGDIDLEFRPSSYFWPLGLETHLLARIKGAERKAALKHLIERGQLDAIPAFLAGSRLSDADRAALGRIHPAFMGGEYLPDLLADEVMVARITIASTTQDVTCVYARRDKDRIHYRVVDEYGGDTLSGRTTCTSVLPLTLGELVEFFTGAWSIFEVLESNFGDNGYDVDEMQAFVTGIDSEFYPALERLYRLQISEWAADHQPGDEEDDDGGAEADARARHDAMVADFESRFVSESAALDEMLQRVTSSWPRPTSYGMAWNQKQRRGQLRFRAIEFFLDRGRLPGDQELADWAG